jgi:peptidoglycan-associated lipoprotein
MLEVLKKNSELIINKNVVLEGNCDEFGSGEYNYALGLKRAYEVKKVFIKLGIKPEMIDITSLGEDNPSCFESSTVCWQKNRRVDVKVRPRE